MPFCSSSNPLCSTGHIAVTLPLPTRSLLQLRSPTQGQPLGVARIVEQVGDTRVAESCGFAAHVIPSTLHPVLPPTHAD